MSVFHGVLTVHVHGRWTIHAIVRLSAGRDNRSGFNSLFDVEFDRASKLRCTVTSDTGA